MSEVTESPENTEVAEPKAELAEAPAVRVKLFGRTDVGQVREHNEDNFLVADLTRGSRGLTENERSHIIGERGTLMAVCDGMGGAAAGEVASQMAVDIIFEKMSEGDVPKDRNELARRLVKAVETAGERIFHEAKNDRSRRGMGTTSTVAALLDDHLFLGQVGDSRAYILRGKRFVQVTRDQSLVNQLIEAGQLTEEEAETFEHNNIILQALGTADTVQVDLTYVKLRQGDVLLVCSDGLSGMIRSEDMREVLLNHAEPLEACKILTEKANQSGGHDNITCIVARFDGDGLLPVAEPGPDGEPPPDGSEGDLKYRKYTLPEEQTIENTKTQPMELPFRDRVTDHEASRSKVSSTIVGLNAKDIQAQVEAAEARKKSGAPPAAFEDEESIHLPVSSTPTWVVGLLVACALGVVAALGFVLLR
jgi:PPM family protein phosphatase